MQTGTLISWDRGGGLISGAWAESLLIPPTRNFPALICSARPPTSDPNTRFLILADGFLFKQWVRCGVVLVEFFDGVFVGSFRLGLRQGSRGSMGGGSVRVDTVLGSVVRVRCGLLFPLAIAAWASRLGCYRVA